MRIPTTWMLIACSWMGVACSTETPVDDAGGPIIVDGGGADVADAWRREAGPLPDTRVGPSDDDGNADLDDAVTLAVGGSATGSITGSGDADYFFVDAAAAMFVAVLIEVDDGVENPSLSLLDPDGRYVLSPSDFLGCAGRSDADQEMVTRLPQAGRYYVEVAAGYGGIPTSSYTVRVIDLATSPSSLIVREGETPTLTTAHACVLGAFEEAGDDDVLNVGLPSFALLATYDRFRHGSTGTARLLTLRAAGRVLASAEPRDGYGAGFDGTKGTELWVEGPEARGANDHYVIRTLPFTYYGPGVNYVESRESTNDSLDTPEPVTLGPPDDGGYLPWFVGSLPAGDVDYFAFDLEYDAPVTVTCRAASLGSAIRGLEVAVFEPDGREVARGRESTTSSYEVNVGASLLMGRHLVQVRAGVPDPTIDGALYACSISS